MTEKRFVCIDIGYGDGWYITDNGERLSEMEIVDLLNEQQAIIHRDEISIKTMMSNMEKLEEKNKRLKEEIEPLVLLCLLFIVAVIVPYIIYGG